LTIAEKSPGSYELEMELNTYRNGEKVDIAKYEFVNEYSGEEEPDEPVEPEKPGKPDKPDTGDNTNYVLPAAVFGAALIALIVMLIRRKRNDK
jgi:LPXTG-motif cell wall-anchored protein